MQKRNYLLLMVLAAVVLAACGSDVEADDQAGEIGLNVEMTRLPSETASALPSKTLTPTATQTASPIPSSTHTFTPIPSYIELRGQVVPEKLSCRFGPGPAYLYKFGFLATTNIEILGRMEHGDWVLVQAIGGDNKCWVKADLLEIDGDVEDLEPVDAHEALVWSPYYGAPTGATAEREEEIVTLFWHPVVLNAGDDSEQVPYVVETWLCVGGEVVFEAIGAYYPEITVVDEKGCEQESWARVAGAEKHGYTAWSEFEWPSH
jgi:hypothetical protein